LNKMRVPPRWLPHAYDVFSYCNSQSRGGWQSTDSGIQKKQLDEDLSPMNVFGLKLQRRGTAESMDSESMMADREIRGGGARRLTLVTNRRLSAKGDGSLISDEVLERVQKLWRTVRGLVNFLVIYFAHMRMMDSVVIVSSFINQLGEWSRLRNGIKLFLWRCTQLQRKCKGFLTLRKQRTDIMNKEFEKVEDSYLRSFSKLWVQRAMEEAEYEAKKGNRARTDSSMEADGEGRSRNRRRAMTSHQADVSHSSSAKFAEAAFDWRALKIPAQYRKALIVRYYMTLAMKRLRNRTTMLDTIKTMVSNQKDLVRFLAKFNYEGQDEAPSVHADNEIALECSSEFWHLSEETVVEIMCIAAELLPRYPEHQNLREHPANRSERLRDEEYDRWCRPPRKLLANDKEPLIGELTGNFMSALSIYRSRGANPVGRSLDKHKKHVPMVPEPVASKGHHVSFENLGEKPSGMNLEEVLQLCTPRLQDIAHQQRAAEATRPHDPDCRLESISSLAAQWDLKR